MTETPYDLCIRLLPEVSRTFALNIPALPAPLDGVVTVAYLLCRIADTVEDSTESWGTRSELLGEVAHLVRLEPGWETRAQAFADRAQKIARKGARLSEIQALAETPRVLAALAEFPSWTRPPVTRCIEVMTQGMGEVARLLHSEQGVKGLPSLEATLTYCYYVAGTVGEMLTSLFLEYSPAVAQRADALVPRSQAFGRALQLTNILKDIREDLERGYCWLPVPMMEDHGLSPQNLLLPERRSQAVELLDELVTVARREADVALEYSLSLPVEETGLRLFCLWPLLFAVKTLALLEGNPKVFDPAPVKIGRMEVARIMAETRAKVTSDQALRALYRECAGT